MYINLKGFQHSMYFKCKIKIYKVVGYVKFTMPHFLDLVFLSRKTPYSQQLQNLNLIDKLMSFHIFRKLIW